MDSTTRLAPRLRTTAAARQLPSLETLSDRFRYLCCLHKPDDSPAGRPSAAASSDPCKLKDSSSIPATSSLLLDLEALSDRVLHLRRRHQSDDSPAWRPSAAASSDPCNLEPSSPPLRLLKRPLPAPRSPTRLSRKRHQYSIEYKLNAIAKWRELKENTSQAARHPDVNVDRQTLKGWILNEHSYRAMSNKKVAKRLRKRTHDNSNNINNVIMKCANIKKEDNVRFVRPTLPEPSARCYSTRYGAMRRTRNSSASLSSMNSSIQQDSSSQPSSAKFPKRAEGRLENHPAEMKIQKSMSHSMQRSHVAQRQLHIQHQLQVQASPSVVAPPAARKVQVFAPAIQVPVTKPKPKPQKKRIFVVADHQRCVMSNLSSLWKSGKLCDAGIGNGTATVKVHKLVLSAVCPRLLSVLNTDVLSHEFLQVNFPDKVSVEALSAFAEYMYNGILDLDRDILEQLKIIARRLDMSEFEQLCDSHLPNHVHGISTAVPSFKHIPSLQTSVSIPSMVSSLVSPITTPIQSAPYIGTQVIDVKREITDAELAQVQKDTAAILGQELTVSSPTLKKSANVAGFVIPSGIKTEPVRPDDDRYGCLSSSNNQVLTPTVSSSSSSLATSTSVETRTSVPTSTAEFSIPFLQSTDVKSTRLKTALVSDPSPISRSVKMKDSQSDSTNENISKKSSRSDSLFPIDNLATNLDYSEKPVYPIGLFSAKGDNLSVLTPPVTEPMTVNCLFTK